MRKQIALNSGAASLHRVLESEKLHLENRISKAVSSPVTPSFPAFYRNPACVVGVESWEEGREKRKGDFAPNKKAKGNHRKNSRNSVCPA